MPTVDEEAAVIFGGKKPVEPLGMWVIFDHHKDYPQGFLARRFFIGPKMILATDDILTGATLEAVRAILPNGLINIGRHEHDEPQIAETWV